MKKNMSLAIAALVFILLAVLVIWKFDRVKLAAGAGPLQGQIEGTSTSRKQGEGAAAPPAATGTVSSARDASDSNLQAATVTTHGSQSPAINVNAGSAPVTVHYGAPDGR